MTAGNVGLAATAPSPLRRPLRTSTCRRSRCCSYAWAADEDGDRLWLPHGSALPPSVEAIVERFDEMKEDLDREKKAMSRLWAKRVQQIGVVIEATAGMYGDLQEICRTDPGRDRRPGAAAFGRPGRRSQMMAAPATSRGRQPQGSRKRLRGLEFGRGLYDLPPMTKSSSAPAGKPHGIPALKVLGVTRDGVHILKPASPATHFTAREIRQAISTVRTAQKAG